MDVLFLHGSPAVGKYTIGALLSPLVDMPLFHNHLIVDAVETLFDFGSPGFIALREEFWLSSFSAAACADQSFIFTFAPEATVDPELIPRLQAVIENQRGRVLYVALTCAPDTVMRRLDSPSREQSGKLHDRNLYQTVLAEGGFDFPPLPTPLVNIDTDHYAPIEAASMIAATYRSLAPQGGR